MVIGRKVSFAILNQMKENDQKIIASTTALYVLNLLLNFRHSWNLSFWALRI
jgi:hypothetical protein